MKRTLKSNDAQAYLLLKIERQGKGQVEKKKQRQDATKTGMPIQEEELAGQRSGAGHVSVEGKMTGIMKCRDISRWKSREFFCFNDYN